MVKQERDLEIHVERLDLPCRGWGRDERGLNALAAQVESLATGEGAGRQPVRAGNDATRLSLEIARQVRSAIGNSR